MDMQKHVEAINKEYNHAKIVYNNWNSINTAPPPICYIFN